MLNVNWILLKQLLFLIFSIVSLTAAIISLKPKVSSEYENYFITRTSDCFPRSVDGHYKLNRPMDLTLGSEWPLHLIVCGAVTPETNGVWTIGHRAVFLLKRLPIRSYVLTIDISDVFLVGKSDYQRVNISTNGITLGSSKLVDTKEHQLSLIIPATVITSRDGALTIEVDLPDVRRAKTIYERRSLGIKISSIMLKDFASID